MRFESLIIMIFLVAMFTSGFMTFASYIIFSNEASPGLATSDFGNENNTTAIGQQLVSMYNESVSMQNTTTENAGNIVAFAPLNLLTGAYNMVMQMVSTPMFFIGLIGDLTSKVTGMPVWVANDLIAIISVICIWALIYLIIGRK